MMLSPAVDLHMSNAHTTYYPRMTLRCECGNEFNVNVIRLKNKESVMCQVCGEVFPPDLGETFANALYDLFTVKHGLERQNSKFNVAFTYKSTFKQPPAPLAFSEDDFTDSSL